MAMDAAFEPAHAMHLHVPLGPAFHPGGRLPLEPALMPRNENRDARRRRIRPGKSNRAVHAEATRYRKTGDRSHLQHH